MVENKYNRNILWFGVDGQRKIERTKVAIIGLGGIGSHVAQQLAYLGVKNFVFIDFDIVNKSNLNRLIGASEKDVRWLKVDAIKDYVLRINKDVKVETIPDSFITKKGIQALKKVDYIFGCVDNDGSRMVLTEFSKAYKKNYFDIATEIITKDEWGGRVVFSNVEEGCLLCRSELSNEEIRRDLSSPQDRSTEDKIYGIPKEELKRTGPAVVSLNGILASFAVTEFLVQVTGIRGAIKNLKYNGNWVSKNNEILDDCYYCKEVLGLGDKVNMKRYIDKGIDKILR